MTWSITKRGLFTVCTGAIGLTVVLIWADLLGHGFGFASSSSGIQPVANARLIFLMGILLPAVVSVFIPRVSAIQSTIFRVSITAVACLGTWLFALAYNQTVFAYAQIAIPALVLCGIGYFGITLYLYTELSLFPKLSTVLWAVSISLIAKTILGDVANIFVSNPYQVILASALPCISLACVRTLHRISKTSIGGLQHVREKIGETRTVDVFRSRNSIVLIIGSAVGVAALRGLGHLGFWGDGYIGSVMTSLLEYVLMGTCLILLTYLIIIQNCNDLCITRYQPAFLVVVIGFLMFLFEQGEAASDPVGLFFTWLPSSIELFSHLLLWAIVLSVARTSSTGFWRIQGFSNAIYAFVAMIWILLLQDAAISTQALVIGIVIVILVTVIRPFGKLPLETEGRPFDILMTEENAKTGQAGPVSDDAGVTTSEDRMSWQDGCQKLAKEYGLSPRETDVMVLLLQGRNRPYICDALCLSDGTVKTHITHIYQKACVHSRQEFLTKAKADLDDMMATVDTTAAPPAITAL